MFLLSLTILYFVFFQKSSSQIINATITVGNGTIDSNKSTISMERITQPSIDRSQSQQIETAVELNHTKPKNLSDFRASPELETYYEYNKFPVKPAYPEAKTLRDAPWTTFGQPQAGQIGKLQKWHDKSSYEHADVPPWSNKHVKFPNNEKSPYPFVTNTGENHNRYVPPPAPSYLTNKDGEGFSFNKPVEGAKYPRPPQYGPIEKTGPWEYERPTISHKPEYNILEKPAPSIQKTYDYGMAEYDVHPWKKILKFLVTFIPIGLLISALTPSVITVSSTNDTNMQTRWRTGDSKQELADHLVSSLDYFDKLNKDGCKFRVFCELLVTASNMQNSEAHVQNLLDNFAKQENDLKSKTEDLKQVFDAVKKQDCWPIKCRNVKKSGHRS